MSKNAELRYLYCSGNQLTSLDVSANIELIRLYCRYNQLTSLDVSNNTKLDGTEALICSYNNLSAEALNRLFETLHSNPPSAPQRVIDIRGNPGEWECDLSIAEDKGWEVR